MRAVHRHEEVGLALLNAHLTDVDVEVAGLVALEQSLLALAGGPRNTGDAVALQAAVQRGAGEGRDRRLKGKKDVVEREAGLDAGRDDRGLLQRREGGAFAPARSPIGRSYTPVLLRHLATVFGFTPWRRASAATGSSELWNSAPVLAVVVALPCRSCAIVPPSPMTRKLHHDTPWDCAPRPRQVRPRLV